MKIAFVGGGNMAQALIGGIALKSLDNQFVVVEPFAAARAKLAENFPEVKVLEAPSSELGSCDALVMAVKPQQFREAARAAAPFASNALVISIAAGIRITEIARWFGGDAGRLAIVRAMPNTPALIGEGIAGLYATNAVDEAQRGLADQVLGAVGSTVWVDDEASLDAVTAISGSGPAYVFAWMEAMQRGARELGLSEEVARRLVLQTFVGATHLAASSDEPIGTLRERVTSKGGTTYAALTRMTERGVPDAIVDAVRAAAARAAEMGDESARDA